MNLSDYEKDSTLIWLINRVKLPKKLPWAFENRAWQIDIIDDQSKYITCRKPTQIGMSTVFLGKMLHFADTYPVRTMFTLPRQDDVYDMVNTRLDEIIRESPYIYEKMGEVDNVRMKKFGSSWIHFSEMSVPPRMLDVDWMVNDEVDLSNPDHLEQALSRMDASQYGFQHKISTPSIEGYGVDAIFEQSDKKYWVVTCPYCLHEQHLDWDKNIAHTEEKGAFYICSRCHENLRSESIKHGRWVPTGSSSALYSGYQINHLMVPSVDPNKLWAESQTMSTRNFYNLRLGLPYTPTSGSITNQMLQDYCFGSIHKLETVANKDDFYVLGADQGDAIHVVVSRVRKNGACEIVFGAKLSFDEGFEELGSIMNRFNIRVAVLDALPNHHSATRLAESFPNRMRIAYFTSTSGAYIEKDEIKLNIDKTDGYDLVVENIVSGNLSFPERNVNSNVLINEIIEHLTNMRRDVVTSTTKAGGQTTRHVWKAVGPDHYADAVLYSIIAADIYNSSQKSFQVVDIKNIDRFLRSVGAEHLIENEDGTEHQMEPFLAPTNPYVRG
jgi:hypothetical protein